MRLSRETWLPVCAALAACAWIARKASSAEPTGALPDLLFVLSLATVGCGLALWCVGRLAPLLRTSDQEWVTRQGRRWIPASASAAVLALVLAVDQCSAIALRSSEPSVVPVVRIACTRITAGTVKATVEAQAVDGRWCFKQRGAVPQGDVLRIDARQVRPGLQPGEAGKLTQRLLPSVIFGQGAYRVLQSVV